MLDDIIDDEQGGIAGAHVLSDTFMQDALVNAYTYLYGHKPEPGEVRNLSRELIYKAQLFRSLEVAPKKGVCSTDAQALNRIYYERFLGIRDHEDEGHDTDDLSLVLMNKREDQYHSSNHPFKKSVSDYIKYKVQEMLGLSYNEWMQKTPIEQEIMKEICIDEIGDEVRRKEKEVEGFENALKGK